MNEPMFEQHWPGERKPRAPEPLSKVLDANKDDPDVCEWLRRPPAVGHCLVVGGGASPVVSLRRVA